ncbi:MAG: magnesium transporter CorA family protein, partial [Muribaculaceae bacterium]|nr:magnesium transporter CorA family protein [Muribaculaceae bacterium]
VPMGVMICGETIISVCFYKNELTGDFIEHTRRRNIGVPSAADFTLRILNSSAYWFLHYLTEIKALREKAEKQLGQSIRNEDLLSMMSLQKVLVIFANSLKGNLLLIERLPKVWAGDVDSDLLDDVEIELRQAETMVDIDMTMLDHTMDTYASVISNNVNAIMKRLTSISVILMIPTLIASFYGMNVDVGVSPSNGWAFGAIVGVAVFLTTLTCLWLRRIKWL